MKKLMLTLFVACLFVAKAQDPERIFARAEILYKQEKYEEALKQYKSLEEKKYKGKELYFNLGNCYFKTGKLGMAIAYYEKARKIDPTDEDIIANLEFANAKTKQTLGSKAKGLTAWFNSVIYMFPADKWTLFGLFLWIAGFAGFMLMKLKIVQRMLKIEITSWVFVVFGGIFLVMGYLHYYFISSQHHAVIVESVHVKATPSENANNLYFLYEGAKVDFHESNNGWYEISVNDNYGWIKQSEAEII